MEKIIQGVINLRKLKTSELFVDWNRVTAQDVQVSILRVNDLISDLIDINLSLQKRVNHLEVVKQDRKVEIEKKRKVVSYGLKSKKT